MRVREYRGGWGASHPPIGAEPPLPDPQGWFCVMLAEQVRPGQVLTVPFMDDQIVVYRTRGGVVRATRPACPHLGAHLGADGEVDGELLICPFHKFGFDIDGACARTPYGSPPRARLSMLPVRETCGIVWVWHSIDDPEPTWEIPEFTTEVRSMTFRVVDMNGHVQDVLENFVDIGHFEPRHQIRLTKFPAEPEIDGITFSVRYRVSRTLVPFGAIEQDVAATMVGPGFGGGSLPISSWLGGEFWVCATPIGPWQMRLWFLSTATLRKDKLPWLLRRVVPTRCAERLLSRIFGYWYYRDTKIDYPMWHHKAYLPHPKLNGGDGPIGPFRRWMCQFYPAPSEAVRQPDSLASVDTCGGPR